MKYNKLGRTDLDVSAICLGTMTWGEQNSETQGHEQMDYALEQGINFFDTAEMYAVPPKAETYGTTEKVIGSWFNSRKKRDQVILATKIAGSGLSWIRKGQATIDKANIFAAAEGSLQRLRTDYIDLYQLHWPNRGSVAFRQNWQFNPSFDATREKENFLEVLEALQDLVQAGKIRYVGLSNETVWGAMSYLSLSEQKNLPRMQSIQNEYSLLCRLFEPELQEMAHAETCGLLAWSPLATGMLSGKYLDGARPTGTRWTIRHDQDRDTMSGHMAVRAYMDIAQKHGLDMCQMALAFVNSRPFVTSNIIGATNMTQLKSNIGSINLNLSPEILTDIETVRRTYPMPF